MDIKSIADLAQVADLCRKKGIESIKITGDSVEFKLTDERPVRKRTTKEKADEPEVRGPTEEEILYWSSAGIPGEIQS